MQLIYVDTTETSIQATLDDGETLGHLTGPAVAFVPTDPANAEYADILANERTVEPFATEGASK